MDWKELGKKIVGVGAPLLGGAVGGPGGAALGGILSEALGVSTDNPDDIARAIDADPEAATKLQQIQSEERIRLREIASERALSETEAETERQRMINETMRSEYRTEGIYKSGWRPFVGWIFGLSIGALIAALIYSIAKDPTTVSNPEFTGLLIWLFTAMAAILGINIRERSRDKRSAQGQTHRGALERIASALRGEGSPK